MLVIKRKVGESFVVGPRVFHSDGSETIDLARSVLICLAAQQNGAIKVLVEAPDDTKVLRSELLEQQMKQ